ncbi:GNAT family N-acetyltransferase [Paenibacillus sp. sptzw28]|uniref:GNAT family N-acetyltransferase n=1 Tax=Paenibacillus sp. sptzw28 TaxID=715179 RepID=UPI001C6EB0F0|nr:GNAT family N-acetyltransferase [Paenibacillus sp. sptzw28]QYR22330.1 GNAT family N-acetyltransferase [Paenibacillus sp. sptzw28]
MLQLIPVPEDKKEVLQNLYQLYHYDFSQFTENDINSFGLYEISLDHYWQDPRWNPFFIHFADKIVGFLVVLFENYDVDPDPTHVIYDFMVLRKFRRTGVGRKAAEKAFNLFKANWKVAQMSNNEPAILFWRDMIREYTGDTYSELFRQDLNKYVQTFSNKGS